MKLGWLGATVDKSRPNVKKSLGAWGAFQIFRQTGKKMADERDGWF